MPVAESVVAGLRAAADGPAATAVVRHLVGGPDSQTAPRLQKAPAKQRVGGAC